MTPVQHCFISESGSYVSIIWHESIPWHLCWIWMPTHPTSSGGPITQRPMHTIICNGCVCLQPSINQHLLREGWGLTCISKNPGPSFDFSKQALHLRAVFSVEDDETELRKQTSMATVSSALVVWFPCRYGWRWSTANCNLNPFS